jgi:hypothetical protein
MKIGPNTEVCVHTLANQMIAAGYAGQNLRDPQKAHAYIKLAAANVDVEHMLPPAGFDFWKTAYAKFSLWQLMEGVAPAPSAEIIQLPQPPEKHTCYMELAEEEKAIYITGPAIVETAKKCERVYVEVNLDNNDPHIRPHIRFRPAKAGEPAIKLQHGPAGAYLRIPVPAGTIVDTSRVIDTDADDTHGGPDAAA